MIFDFETAVTWSDIISASASFFTMVAVIVAMIANHNSNKQLKVSLRIQEQSKNVDLLDKRIGVLNAIRSEQYVSSSTISVLFNDEIHGFYQDLFKTRQKCTSLEHDKKYYLQCLQDSDGEGGYVNTVKGKIADYQRDMAQPDCPESTFAEYEAFCKSKALLLSESGLEEDRRWYNYADMEQDLNDALEHQRDLKDSLLTLIELYIKDSIAPVKE